MPLQIETTVLHIRPQPLVTLFNGSCDVCWLKDAKVWIPDASAVWKCASLVEDYKGQQQALRVCYEDGTVSLYIFYTICDT